MSEFIPFSPFSWNNLGEQFQSIIDQTMVKHQLEGISNSQKPQQNSLSNNQCPSHGKKISLNHNLVKQLNITIKKMMKPHIKNICVGKLKEIIEKIWDIFMSDKHPSKQILKALFDAPNENLIQKYKLKEIITKYGKLKYAQAISQLKYQILEHMKLEDIKVHLMDRRIKNKQRLTAYIYHFLHQELGEGKIGYRQNQKAGLKINQLMSKLKEQQMFVDRLFEQQEVEERFASINNETS